MFAMDRESLLLGEAPSFQDVPRECLVVRPWSACRAKASQRQGCSYRVSSSKSPCNHDQRLSRADDTCDGGDRWRCRWARCFHVLPRSDAWIVADGRLHYQSETLTGLDFTALEYQESYVNPHVAATAAVWPAPGHALL